MAFEPDDAEEPLYGLYLGRVVQNEDPEKLGRVKVLIPGLCDPESAWALPLSVGGGARGRGVFDVPDLGATAGVLFIQGDVNEPCYLGGLWGAPDGKTEMSAARGGGLSEADARATSYDPDLDTAAGVIRRRGWGSEKWILSLDDSEGVLTIQHRTEALGISLSARDRSVTIFGTTHVKIGTDGLVSIEGARVQIQGRIVSPVGGPI